MTRPGLLLEAQLRLREGQGTKTDEFSENFQCAGWGEFLIQKFMLHILDLDIGFWTVSEKIAT